ncbi:hydrolase [Streptomyces sp. GMR22]|uniref:hydrolase n=1 Tax=Streptomyces sp. GMR22 TaxID=2759524 RepID=UPI0015F96826|nr:hydrolase [Streptomyces sp. GMR22]MBA6437029.1 hydrolase [Streptomyces sp. GMR22]
MPEVSTVFLHPEDVRETAVLAAKRAAGAETERRLTPDVVESVIGAGFARHLVPARWGGSAGGFAELLQAVVRLGESCTSTAWFASLAAGVARLAAYLPLAGQHDIWAQGPDTIVVGALAPMGSAEPVSGGWRVRGRWSYVSGVGHSRWALVCARVVSATAQPRFFAVPRASYGIVDTWFNTGMRATGSNTLTLDDVFIATTHSVALDELTTGLAPEAKAPCHRVPLKAANGLTLAAPLLGAARGALGRWTSLERAKREAPAASVSGAPDRTAYELTQARAEAEIDAAELLLERAAGVADSGRADPLLAARNARDCSLAAEMLAVAVDRLLRSAGSRGQSETEDLQRFWRDVNSGAGHAALQFPAAAAAYVRLLADVPAV